MHRDIKPANLLLDVQGNLWITDFGLARLQDDAGLTITGDLLGTLRYMSPEQALAKRGYLDHRTDIYSLGATLYELVTLRPAIDGQDRQEVLRKIAQDEPTPPRRLNPAIPRELETILLKAMNKEPESRYATAQELADDLRRFLEHKPIKAKRPNVWERVVEVVAAAHGDRRDRARDSCRHRSGPPGQFHSFGTRTAKNGRGPETGRVAIAAGPQGGGQDVYPRGREMARRSAWPPPTSNASSSRRPWRSIKSLPASKVKTPKRGSSKPWRCGGSATSRMHLIITNRPSGFTSRRFGSLEGMGDPSSEDPVVRQELAITQVRLAELYRVDGRTDDGVRLFEQALAMYQALGTLDPQRVEYRCGGARCLVGLARSSLQVGKADETERLWHRARDLYGSAGIGLETSSESKEGLRSVYHGLGFSYCVFGRFLGGRTGVEESG